MKGGGEGHEVNRQKDWEEQEQEEEQEEGLRKWKNGVTSLHHAIFPFSLAVLPVLLLFFLLFFLIPRGPSLPSPSLTHTFSVPC